MDVVGVLLFNTTRCKEPDRKTLSGRGCIPYVPTGSLYQFGRHRTVFFLFFFKKYILVEHEDWTRQYDSINSTYGGRCII